MPVKTDTRQMKLDLNSLVILTVAAWAIAVTLTTITIAITSHVASILQAFRLKSNLGDGNKFPISQTTNNSIHETPPS